MADKYRVFLKEAVMGKSAITGNEMNLQEKYIEIIGEKKLIIPWDNVLAIQGERSVSSSPISTNTRESKKQVNKKSSSKKYFNIHRKQLVLMKGRRFYEKESKEMISVVGDALEISEVLKFVKDTFTFDVKYEEYAKPYSEDIYKDIRSKLYQLARRYKFALVEM